MLGMFLGLFVAAVSLVPFAAQADDRKPTADELAKIEGVLQAEGFVQWEDIDWDDDGYWEVDDAETSTGQKYDLKIDQTFDVVEREED